MQNPASIVAAVIVVSLTASNFAYGASFKTLYSFMGTTDGALPNTLVALNGTLYGTTDALGGEGTVFSLTTGGTETVLHYFSGSPDGIVPTSLTVFDGSLFGTTQFGGPYSPTCGFEQVLQGCGTVFGVAPATGKERVVQTFQVAATSSFSAQAGSLAGLDNALYGIANGGANGLGAVFKTKNGVEEIVYSFKGGTDGSGPNSLIRIGSAFYGTTGVGGGAGCGGSGCGTIFKLTPDGTEAVLYSFTGGADGEYPQKLVNGGGELFTDVTNAGNGSIVELRGGKLKVVYTFTGPSSDGTFVDSLTHIGDTLYGTTHTYEGDGAGTLFALTKAGQKTVLHTFAGGADGKEPTGVINVGGTIYGVTISGGITTSFPNGAGTVFSYTP